MSERRNVFFAKRRDASFGINCLDFGGGGRKRTEVCDEKSDGGDGALLDLLVNVVGVQAGEGGQVQLTHVRRRVHVLRQPQQEDGEGNALRAKSASL